jgi:hypothetical protein
LEVGVWPALEEMVVPLSEFIEHDLSGAGDRVAYLAQHGLFDQVLELRDHYVVCGGFVVVASVVCSSILHVSDPVPIGLKPRYV